MIDFLLIVVSLMYLLIIKVKGQYESIFSPEFCNIVNTSIVLFAFGRNCVINFHPKLPYVIVER